MHCTRISILAVSLLISGWTQAEVRVQGPVEYGVFVSDYPNVQAGERVITRSQQTIAPGAVIPAKRGTKFGLRFSLEGKTADDAPLTLLYLTPGVITPDGKRHDKFVVTQKLLPAATQDVMAFEFTEMHEVVPGEWHFMLFQEDRKLLEQRFTVR